MSRSLCSLEEREEMSWNNAKTLPLLDAVVVCLEGGTLYFAKIVSSNPTEWLECERDGSAIFGRDGAPIYQNPDLWCELPKRTK